MLEGKAIRMGKVCGIDGKAMLVAADHGMMLGPIKGVVNLEETLKKIIQGGCDGILVSPGQAMRIHHLFHGKRAPAMLVRGDFISGFRTLTYTLPNERIHHFRLISPQKALALGASAMVVYYILGRPDDPANDEATNIKVIAEMARESEMCGLPFIIEPMPYGPRSTGSNYNDLLRIGIRVAEEIGADGIKIPYSGDPESFKRIVDSVDIPVFILGGAKSKTYREAIELVEEAMQAGAKGTVFGRQLVQDSNPEILSKYLMQIVHENKTTKDLFGVRIQTQSRIKINLDKCTGCGICSDVCASVHIGGVHPDFYAIRVKNDFPKRFKIQLCTHCYQCETVCPQHAIIRDPKDGHVLVDPKKCDMCANLDEQNGTRLRCIPACPMHVIKAPLNVTYPNYNARIPFMCDFCGGLPECIEWCPQECIELEEYPKHVK